jgi:OOP family OmpA-OmpF porin
LAGNRDTKTIGNTMLSLAFMYRFGEPTPVAVAAPEPMPAPAPAPAPMPAPAPAPVCVHSVEQFTLGADTLFAFDKSDLTAAGKEALDAQVAAKMKANPIYATVRIEGHTDRLGSDEYNQALSERRANTVREYLINQGIESERLVAVGMGEDIPLVDCKGVKGTKALIECLAPNRRVEIQATRSMMAGCE